MTPYIPYTTRYPDRVEQEAFLADSSVIFDVGHLFRVHTQWDTQIPCLSFEQILLTHPWFQSKDKAERGAAILEGIEKSVDQILIRHAVRVNPVNSDEEPHINVIIDGYVQEIKKFMNSRELGFLFQDLRVTTEMTRLDRIDHPHKEYTPPEPPEVLAAKVAGDATKDAAKITSDATMRAAKFAAGSALAGVVLGLVGAWLSK